MIASSDRIRLSPEAYLAWETDQPVKYEYLNGEAYAVTGVALAHNDIAVNLTTLLKNHLRRKSCQEPKVGVTAKGPFFYPDVLVTCNRADLIAKTLVQHPCLIIEILSPGTEGYDRGEKFKQYRKIDSLKEYGLVNADTMGVDIYRLNAAGKWELTPYFPEAASEASSLFVDFVSLDFKCAIADIYEAVEFFPESSHPLTDNDE